MTSTKQWRLTAEDGTRDLNVGLQTANRPILSRHEFADVLHFRFAAAGRWQAGEEVGRITKLFFTLGHAEVVAFLQNRAGERHFAECTGASGFTRVPMPFALGMLE